MIDRCDLYADDLSKIKFSDRSDYETNSPVIVPKHILIHTTVLTLLS